MQVRDVGVEVADRTASTSVAGVELIDLLNDLDALAQLLIDEVRALPESRTRESRTEHVLDAFLFAAGMVQITEDHLHSPGFRVPWRDRRIDRWLAGVEALTADLAAAVANPTRDTVHLEETAASVAAAKEQLPRSLRREIVRLPDCFRSFDQRPDDCRRLAQAFLARWPDRNRHLLVVGVRTSGSYLAPLTAAYLATEGCAHVDSIGLRPGRPWTGRDRQRLRDLVEHGGLVLLVDDPPVTGRKLVASADQLEAAGVPPGSIVFLVPLLGDERSLPRLLEPHQVVTLPWAEWAVQTQLTDEGVRSSLAELLPAGRVPDGQSIEQLQLDPIPELRARPLLRSHLRAARRVTVRDSTGMASPLDIYIKGTGIGYLGRHSMAVARRLPHLVPQTYGWRDGLLYRAFLPEQSRLTNERRIDQAGPIARYVAERADALRVAGDRSPRLRDRGAAAGVIGEWLATRFGRLSMVASLFLVPYVARTLRPLRPSVVDGSTALSHWFLEAHAATGLLKVDYDERDFSVWHLYSYDPVIDLANAAADAEIRSGDGEGIEFGRRLLAEYHAATGEDVSDERWFLYRTMHIRSVMFHLQRLVRDGASHLQTHEGTPAVGGPSEDPPGFGEDLDMNIERCRDSLIRAEAAYLGSLTSRTSVIAECLRAAEAGKVGRARHLLRAAIAFVSTYR